MQRLLEICCGDIDSVDAAIAGGADRIELCSALSEGGLTPSAGLIAEATKRGIAVNVLIRPRGGDFVYTKSETDIMLHDIATAATLGANGVVIGALSHDGTIDTEVSSLLILKAKSLGLETTYHRAFDMCRDPFKTMEESIELGIKTILTSGQQQSAWEGRELLVELIKKAEGRIDIMAGSGISASAIQKLLPVIKGSTYHMSGKVTLDSAMKYRKQEVSMGLPSLSEYEICQTS